MHYRVPQLGRQSHPSFCGRNATALTPVGTLCWLVATQARN